MDHWDEFCCDDITQVAENELVDTRNGETYEDSYACLKCERVWVVEQGVRTYGTYQSEEVYKSECQYGEILAEARRIKEYKNER